MKNHILNKLIQSYPDFLEKIEGDFLVWKDGERMPLDSGSIQNIEPRYENPELLDQFIWDYEPSTPENFNQIPTQDPGRIRYAPFFKKMYGSSESEVRSNLVSISWMPKTTKKKILVTTINGIDKKLSLISSELDKLPSDLKKYAAKTAGAFNWRNIADSENISPHSFGIAIDINPQFANYWKWDCINNQINYRNNIPYEIVRIFERYGFIWGGKWHHYDTMHFEYRPEFFPNINDIPRAKILYLTTGRESYGSQRQLKNLINNIDINKYCPVVVHTEEIQKSEFKISEHIQTTRINLRPWRKLKNIFHRYIDAYKLLYFSKMQGINLIHCNYQWLYPYALFVSKRMNIPIILHIRRPNNTNFKKLNYQKAQAIIAISKRITKELDQFKRTIHTIHDSIDDVFFKKIDNSTLKTEFNLQDQIVFGLVGRIYKNKKQLEYIKAAEQLVHHGVNAKFFIIGRVDDENYYQELIKYINSHDLTNDILFTGHRKNMPEILNSLDILVSLSGGSVMYEAMALGKTVISAGFTTAENSTHLKHNITGLVTDSKSIADLVHFMKLAVNNKDLRINLGKNAKAVATSNLSSHIQAIKTQQIYEQLLSAR